MNNRKGINRRELIQGSLSAVTAFGVRQTRADVLAAAEGGPGEPKALAKVSNRLLSIWIGCGPDCLWRFRLYGSDRSHSFAPPVFPVDGKLIPAAIEKVRTARPPVLLSSGATRHIFEGSVTGVPELGLALEFEVNDDVPIIRFRYTLKGASPHVLTRTEVPDKITYLSFSLAGLTDVREVSLSRFAAQAHSYQVTEEEVHASAFENGLSLFGPILAATDGQQSFVIAYEHGSQVPNAFLQFEPSRNRDVRLSGVKGNYYAGQIVSDAHPFQTLWLETGAIKGGMDQMASTYRSFVLDHLAQNPESRKPYVFYNTWNFQERNKWWHGKPYLSSMNQERILEEIDAAHRMGIGVYVLDTGWYEKTGDWTVSKSRFPENLKTIKAKLDDYGMKLGLWLGPTSAAVSSEVVRSHPEWRMSWNGQIGEPQEVWETEKSYQMCLVSGYADVFADVVVRLARDIGVAHFKWDGISQYGCNDPHHNHGNQTNTLQERTESYAFQLVQCLANIADKIAAAMPGVAVELDVTEQGRPVGLNFLAAGKYFQINNGPYYFNYDVPIDKKNQNWNLFFYQGQARAWIMRSQLGVDRWIPSICFLTHYFPDDPLQWQEVAVASLILGHNGIWGDLPAVSDAGVEYIGNALQKYKEISADVTSSDPVTTGVVSGNPEIHEKIAKNGKGAVVVFATTPGKYSYVTKNQTVSQCWARDATSVSLDLQRRAKIDAYFDKPGARIVLFGVGSSIM